MEDIQRLRISGGGSQPSKVLNPGGKTQKKGGKSLNTASENRLKVGIDFGTTFSGVAWTYTGNTKEVEIIKEWPGSGRNSDKVPTEISYTETGEVHKWGFEIKPGEERVVWFKLLLDPKKYDITQSHTIIRSKELMRKYSKQPEDVVADFLRCLREYAEKRIERAYGKAFVNTTPVDYILSVPAIWSNLAKNLTLQAAELAGFGSEENPIQLISEPEAAAAWTILKDINPNNFNTHDAFVIVDCGGGTVDLISYEIEKLKPLTLRECATGKGELCGSTFLNQRFENWVQTRIGTEKYDGMNTTSRNGIIKEFEEGLKRNFADHPEDDEISQCPSYGLPDDPEASIEDGEFILTREDMKSIFDPVIDQIIPLVQDQINTVNQQFLHLSAILLVGGFGASKYLYKRLETELIRSKNKKNRHKTLELLQPANAWSAVARGAALGIRISSRRARKHYGIPSSIPFDRSKHPVDSLTYCPFDGQAYCGDWMMWYIKKGEQIAEDKPVSISFFRKIGSLSGFQNTGTRHILECEEDKAPEYANEAMRKDILKKSAPLVSTLPMRAYTRTIGPQMVPYYVAQYNLVMKLTPAAMMIFYEEFEGDESVVGQVKYSQE